MVFFTFRRLKYTHFPYTPFKYHLFIDCYRYHPEMMYVMEEIHEIFAVTQ